MTLNGFFREVAAASRRAQRDAERRQRAAVRAAKLQAKLDELECARAEVEEYEERMQGLANIHHRVGEAIDWQELAAKPPPIEPQRKSTREDAAVKERDEFQPRFWHRWFGGEAKARAKLEENIREAKAGDEAAYQSAVKLYRQHYEAWQGPTAVAQAVLRGETAAYRKAVDEMDPLAELIDMGGISEIQFPDRATAFVRLLVDSDRVVPQEAKSLTSRGKLTVKTIPAGKRNELYQDYVCGCALRAARELLTFLPLARVVVQVEATLLDAATGHARSQPILSVGIPRATLDTMRLDSVDPSEAMRLFPHRMGFKRSQGFFAVQPLPVEEYPAVSEGLASR
jgi:hypothetical protein